MTDADRRCEGFAGRACTTILARSNTESICAICSRRRADEIIRVANLRRGTGRSS